MGPALSSVSTEVAVMHVADLAIALAYFFIPLEMITCLVRKRYAWMIGRKAWSVSILFICFIFLCGCTHLLSVVGGGVTRVVVLFKVLTALVSIATSVLLCWILPEALSLPQYVRDITAENKLMRDFRAVTNTMRRVLQEDAIIDSARLKLKRVLPPNALISIGKEPPADYCGSRELLSLPIDGSLAMYLRRSRLSEAQVTWLHDICVQMKIALQQASSLRGGAPPAPATGPPTTSNSYGGSSGAVGLSVEEEALEGGLGRGMAMGGRLGAAGDSSSSALPLLPPPPSSSSSSSSSASCCVVAAAAGVAPSASSSSACQGALPPSSNSRRLLPAPPQASSFASCNGGGCCQSAAAGATTTTAPQQQPTAQESAVQQQQQLWRWSGTGERMVKIRTLAEVLKARCAAGGDKCEAEQTVLLLDMILAETQDPPPSLLMAPGLPPPPLLLMPQQQHATATRLAVPPEASCSS